MNYDTALYPPIVISKFEPFGDKKGVWKPGVVPIKDDLYKQLFAFKEGYYANLIQDLRTLKTKKEKDTYKVEKLSAFTFSVEIQKKRSTENIIRHTGILVIDIDHEGVLPYLKKRQEEDEDYNLDMLRNELCRMDENGRSHILFAGLSASGTGLFLMFKIHSNQHLESFNAIAWEFQTFYGIKIDQACKDQVRLRFCTYDPNAIIRNKTQVELYEPSSEYLDWRVLQDSRKTNLKKKTRTFTSNAEASSQIINVAVGMVENAADGERHTKTRDAARLLGGYVATGVLPIEYAREMLVAAVEGRDDWDDPTEDAFKAIDWGLDHGQTSPLHLDVLSPEDPQFEFYTKINEERQTKFKKYYQAILQHNKSGIPYSDIEFAELCVGYDIDIDRGKAIASRLYRTHKDEFNWDKIVPLIKLKIIIAKKWELRRNVLTGDLYIRVNGSGQKWAIASIEQLCFEVSKLGFPAKIEQVRLLTETDVVTDYNPFEDYFKRAHKKYDGHTDYIDKLCEFLVVKNIDRRFFKMMFKKMLVRAVRGALEDHYVNRYVFVFASPVQNTGKSWFIRWLNPWGQQAYYAENPLEDSKDGRIRMCEVFIYNLEELSTINKYDVNRLKATISMGSVRERKPYARQAETITRRCSFFGSTNRTDFLVDDSNTRWLVFEVDKLDWGYSANINPIDIWGQAHSLYKNNWDAELSTEESNYRDNLNKNFVEITTEDNLLIRHFRPCTQYHKNARWMTVTDIMDRIMAISDNTRIVIAITTLGRALRRNGFKGHRIADPAGLRGTIRYYPVIPLNQDKAACLDVRNFNAIKEVPDLNYDEPQTPGTKLGDVSHNPKSQFYLPNDETNDKDDPEELPF